MFKDLPFLAMTAILFIGPNNFSYIGREHQSNIPMKFESH